MFTHEVIAQRERSREYFLKLEDLLKDTVRNEEDVVNQHFRLETLITWLRNGKVVATAKVHTGCNGKRRMYVHVDGEKLLYSGHQHEMIRGWGERGKIKRRKEA